MILIPTAAWNKYKAIIRDAHNSFNGETLTWVRGNNIIRLFQEQEEPGLTYVDLKVLISFNYFRQWPITQRDQGGEQDVENMLVLINKQYLKELGYLTPAPREYFNFKPGVDFFIHRGIKYKSEGDTFNSQAYDDPLFLQLILRREEILVGDDPLNAKVQQSVILEPEVDILKILDSNDL